MSNVIPFPTERMVRAEVGADRAPTLEQIEAWISEAQIRMAQLRTWARDNKIHQPAFKVAYAEYRRRLDLLRRYEKRGLVEMAQ